LPPRFKKSTKPAQVTPPEDPAEVPIYASEGGQEAEQRAAAALRHLPAGLLNTGDLGARRGWGWGWGLGFL